LIFKVCGVVFNGLAAGFSPLNSANLGKGFSLGLLYAGRMKIAPQELRTYLLTAVTAQRRSLFQVTARAELFIATLQDNRARGRFELHSFVVMPDHVHLLLTPAPDVSREKAVQLIKGGFSFRLKSKMDVWERSYDSRRIVDGVQFDAKTIR